MSTATAEMGGIFTPMVDALTPPIAQELDELHQRTLSLPRLSEAEPCLEPENCGDSPLLPLFKWAMVTLGSSESSQAQAERMSAAHDQVRHLVK